MKARKQCNAQKDATAIVHVVLKATVGGLACKAAANALHAVFLHNAYMPW